MSKKTDLQAKAASLGIEFDGKTSTEELEAKIAEKEASEVSDDAPAPEVPPSAPAEAGTAPAATDAPDTPPEEVGDAGKGFDVVPNGKFQVVRSKDGKSVRMFDRFSRPISPVVASTDSGAVEQLTRDCSRHNALAAQAK